MSINVLQLKSEPDESDEPLISRNDLRDKLYELSVTSAFLFKALNMAAADQSPEDSSLNIPEAYGAKILGDKIADDRHALHDMV